MNETTPCVVAPKDTISNKIPRIYDILGDLRSMSINICNRITHAPGENPHDKTDENLENLEGVLDNIYYNLIDIRDYLRPVTETLN